MSEHTFTLHDVQYTEETPDCYRVLALITDVDGKMGTLEFRTNKILPADQLSADIVDYIQSINIPTERRD